MKTIAILHTPQECGDQTLDFVSTESGQVITSVTTEGFRGNNCMEKKSRYAGKERIGYFIRARHPMEASYMEYAKGNISHFALYKDEECTIPYLRRRRDKDLYVKEISFLKETRHEVSIFEAPTLYVYKITLDECEFYTEYNKELDYFYDELKDSFGLELSIDQRRSMSLIEDFIPLMAKHLGYEVVNVLCY